MVRLVRFTQVFFAVFADVSRWAHGDAAGNPLLIEHGTRQSTGEARLTVMPDDAKTRIRIRVH